MLKSGNVLPFCASAGHLMPPVAKPAHQRQRQNRSVAKATIEASPAKRLDLAELLPENALHRMTLWTWNVWWASPLTAEWVDADVPDLVDVALLVDAFWTADDPIKRAKIHAEMRMAMQQFGLTPMSRRSLQWEIKRLEGPKPREEPRTPRRSSKSTLGVLMGGKAV